jgi:hypothetical protein
MQLSSETLTSILDIIRTVVAGVMGAEGKTGIVKAFREAGAAASFLVDASKMFKGNAIVEQLIEALRDTTRSDNDQEGRITDITKEGVLSKLGGLDALLGDSADGKGVKEFILGLAEKVAGASGSGLFGTGEKITTAEKSLLDDLKGKLGL